MPGCMLITAKDRPVSPDFLSGIRESVNMAHGLVVRERVEEGLHAVVSFVRNCRIGEGRFFDDGRVCAWYAGYLVDYDAVPWNEVVPALETGDYGYFEGFKSHFALCAHFRDKGETFLVSDRCSQQPFFHSAENGRFLCSTTLSTFLCGPDRPQFEEKWLTDFIFFNFPLSDTTAVRNVRRMPAASVLRVDARSGRQEIRSYAPRYAADIPTCSEKEMKERTCEVFSQRIPKYYNSLQRGRYAASVTSGFDSRVAISFKPEGTELELYTYGIAGCPDMAEGARIASALGLRHHALEIDEDVLAGLFGLARKTLELSGGTLNALRSTLAFSYGRLAGLDLESVITGISADHFFRSSGATPHTFSVAAVQLVKDPSYRPDQSGYLAFFRDRDAARGHFDASCRHLENAYSWSSLPLSERQLTYAHYELAAKYFGGELALADNYVSMVSPYWDADIRSLSYRSTLSTLTLTPFLYEKFPYWKRHSLFGHVLDRHCVFRKLPVHGLLPAHYALGEKLPLLLFKTLRLGPGKVAAMFAPRRNAEVPLEDWKAWVRLHILPEFLNNFDELRICRYLSPDVVRGVMEREIQGEGDHYLVGKFVTAELVLSLLDGWRAVR